MKTLIKNISLYSIVRILPPILSFILLPFYTKYTSTSDYGIISSMQVLNSVFVVLFVLAFDLALYRIYHDYSSKEDKKELLGTIFMTIVASGLIFSSLLIIFSDFTNLFFPSIDFFPYYFLTISYTFLQIFSTIPLVYYQMNHKALLYVILSLSSTIITIFFIIFFLIFQGEGAIGYLKGELFGKLILAPVYLFVTYKIISFKFSYSKLNNTLKFSLPMIPGILCAWIINLSDRIFIEKYLTLEDVAIYSVGYKLGSIVLILFGAISMAYSPYFYEKASMKDQKKVKFELGFINSTIIILSIYCSVFLILFANNLVDIFFDMRYENALIIIPIITFAYLFSLATGLLNLMFNQKKKSLDLMYIILFGAIMNFIFNFLLIPTYGMYGAAWATLISFSLIFFIQLILSKNYYYVPFDKKLILNYTLPVILICPLIILDRLDLKFLIFKIIVVIIYLLFLYKKLKVKFKLVTD